MLQIIDPYESLYEPSTIQYRRYPKRVVDAVDYLIKVSGTRSDVVTSSDWMVIGKIMEFWCRFYPEEWREFLKSMNEIKATRARKDGYSKQLGRNGVRYLAAIPPRLMKLIKIIFPHQQWNRTFTEKFMNNIKISRVGEKIDTWFTIPEAPLKRKSLDEVVKEAIKSDNGNTK